MTGAAILALVISGALEPGPQGAPFATMTNPVGIPGTREGMIVVNYVGWGLTVAIIGMGAAATVVRLGRARGDERQQLKVVMTVGAVIALIAVLDMCTWFIWPHGALQQRIGVLGLCFSAYAIAAGTAVLRYRLYDVDVAIDRTLVYGTLTLLLAGAYAVTTLALGTALGSGSPWATAGATLVVAVAFRPLRTAMQDLVDRRFRRARYEALRRVGVFLDELRAGRAAPEAIEPLLRELLSDPSLELRFFLPESEVYVDPRGMPVAEVVGDPRVRTPIERGRKAGGAGAASRHRAPAPEPPDDRSSRRAAWPSRSHACASSCAVSSPRSRPPGRGSWPRQTPSGGGSSVTCMTARSSGWSRSGWPCATPSTSFAPARRRGPARHSTASVSELAVAIAGAARARPRAPAIPARRAAWRRRCASSPARAPLPVEVRTTAERFASGVEAAAYFIACEGLTNAIKHARAREVAAQRPAPPRKPGRHHQ